jgi:hypothetical protein
MRRIAGAVLAGCWVALAACTDGYQGDEPPLLLHYDMPLPEALAAMDRVYESVQGRDAGVALRETCVLAWSAERQPASVFLPGTQATLDPQAEPDHFSVVLTDAGAAATDDAAAVTVLTDSPWTDATQLKWLLEYLRRFC